MGLLKPSTSTQVSDPSGSQDFFQGLFANPNQALQGILGPQFAGQQSTFGQLLSGGDPAQQALMAMLSGAPGADVLSAVLPQAQRLQTAGLEQLGSRHNLAGNADFLRSSNEDFRAFGAGVSENAAQRQQAGLLGLLGSQLQAGSLAQGGSGILSQLFASLAQGQGPTDVITQNPSIFSQLVNAFGTVGAVFAGRDPPDPVQPTTTQTGGQTGIRGPQGMFR